ncbi:uncharacterized protein CTRU02_204505 [Colletotrichum truncatum]|uniref:Uncharacterized protein n=1 Tax=Colletotrichum truncatum TaxID=5467 RepID=A0ACC3ZC83_COLTU
MHLLATKQSLFFFFFPCYTSNRGGHNPGHASCLNARLGLYMSNLSSHWIETSTLDQLCIPKAGDKMSPWKSVAERGDETMNRMAYPFETCRGIFSALYGTSEKGKDRFSDETMLDRCERPNFRLIFSSPIRLLPTLGIDFWSCTKETTEAVVQRLLVLV